MSDLNGLLAGIVGDPLEETRWLVLADWLEESDDPRRAELLRLHRRLLATCCEPDARPERVAWHARIMELLRSGVRPCVPQHTLVLPGWVKLSGTFVPPGSFRMGSPETEEDRADDEAAHVVTLTRGFFAGVYPVTEAQWSAVMGENPSDDYWESLPKWDVSWKDSQAYCRKVSELTRATVRLPTEAEWEFACRAGTSTPFFWGGELNEAQANCNPNCLLGTRPSEVGRFAGEWPHPWGLADVHGNVLEWCADWYDKGFYGRSPREDPLCEDGPRTSHVARGGSHFDSPENCRAAYRSWFEPDYSMDFVGFRVVFCLD